MSFPLNTFLLYFKEIIMVYKKIHEAQINYKYKY